MLELCSNSKCPVKERCNRATDFYREIIDKAGVKTEPFVIKHFHPVGRGRDMYCRGFLQRSKQ